MIFVPAVVAESTRSAAGSLTIRCAIERVFEHRRAIHVQKAPPAKSNGPPVSSTCFGPIRGVEGAGMRAMASREGASASGASSARTERQLRYGCMLCLWRAR